MRANILDAAARPFKQKTRMDTMRLTALLGRSWVVDGAEQHV